MKASQLKKDIRATIRLSIIVKEELARKGQSIQEAFDKYIDDNLSFDIFPNQGNENGVNKMVAKKKAGAKKDGKAKAKDGKAKASKQAGAKKSSKK